RVDRAIEIARRASRKLKIAAKIDRVDRYYFNKHIKHLLNEPFIEFIGEVGHAEKNKLLGGAFAFLFPIDWPEPFGLVMIEALACGTPVIGFPCGSVPEIIVEGETGFIVERIVRKLTGVVGARRPDYQTSHSDYAKVLEPDYCKARLLEIGVGRRFWQSNRSPENAHTFYERVVQPLRRLHCQGVVEKLQ